MLSISKSVRLTTSPDGGILLNVQRGSMFSLNPVGARIIQLLERPQTRTALLRQISSDFHVSESEAAPDLDEFLSVLRERELLDGDA